MILRKEFRFEAAHWLPRVCSGHPCGRLHGHSYRVVVAVEGTVEPKSGWVVDFSRLKDCWKPLEGLMDHHCLNDLIENPTSENLAIWLWDRLSPSLTGGNYRLKSVIVSETHSSEVEYEGE